MTFLTFILLLSFAASIRSQCHPSDRAEGYQEIISVINASGNRGGSKHETGLRSERNPAAEKHSRRMFSEEILQICPKVSRTRLWKSRTPEPALLGQGAYGSVFCINFESETRAVKQINLLSILEKNLKNAFQKEGVNARECMLAVLSSNKILRSLADEMFTRNRQSKNDNLMTSKGKFSAESSTASTFDFESLPGCDNVADANALIHSVIQITFGLISQEMDISMALSDYSLAFESKAYPSFAKIHSCIIDPNFNIFMVMKKLGPTLGQVRSACPISLSGHDLHRRLLFALRLLYQIQSLHSMGYVHCDLKLDNLMFAGEELDNFHIIDFGLAARKNICLGGTPGYLPWEHIYKTIEASDRDQNFGSLLTEKHDVFASGMILLAWELGFAAWNSLLSETSQLKGQQFNIRVKDWTIQNSLKLSLKNEYVKRYGDELEMSTDAKVSIDKEYGRLLKKAILLDVNERLPVKVLLRQLYSLYTSLMKGQFNAKKFKAESKDLNIMAELIADDKWLEEVSKILQIRKWTILI